MVCGQGIYVKIMMKLHSVPFHHGSANKET